MRGVGFVARVEVGHENPAPVGHDLLVVTLKRAVAGGVRSYANKLYWRQVGRGVGRITRGIGGGDAESPDG